MLEIRQGSGARELRLVGELDLSNVDATAEGLRAAMNGAGSWTLDLSELDFLGVDGARMFVELAYQLDGELQLVHVKRVVRRVLDLTDVGASAPNLVISPDSS